jgi:hypothetical protein
LYKEKRGQEMAEEKTKRYRVKVKNAKDNLTYVPFPDLVVKYTNGWAEPLKIKEGDEIPISACDSEDVRKSWLAGSLKRYTDTGWIEEIPEEIKPKQPTEKELKFLELIKPMQGTGDIPLIPIPPKPVSNKTEEVAKPNLSEAQNTLSNFSLVKTYDDFCKLSYFLRQRFIKESSNKELLKEILNKTESHQFKNLISLKLSQIR